MEGHPDNVAPAILGDFVVASHVENQVYHVKHHFPMCDVIAFIPEEPLFTEKVALFLPEKNWLIKKRSRPAQLPML